MDGSINGTWSSKRGNHLQVAIACFARMLLLSIMNLMPTLTVFLLYWLTALVDDILSVQRQVTFAPKCS